MDAPYITITLELSGTDEEAMLVYHTFLRERLRLWQSDLSYGELHIAYQEQVEIDADARVDADEAC